MTDFFFSLCHSPIIELKPITNFNQNCICAIIPNRLNIHPVHVKLSGTPNHLLHNDRGEILESAEIGVFSRIHEGIKYVHMGTVSNDAVHAGASERVVL